MGALVRQSQSPWYCGARCHQMPNSCDNSVLKLETTHSSLNAGSMHVGVDIDRTGVAPDFPSPPRKADITAALGSCKIPKQ